jgi:signal transduction histidine kinase
MVSRWMRPLWRLQGQLTLSYIFVTVVAMLTLIGATAVMAAVALHPKTQGNGKTTAFVDKVVVLSVESSVAPYIVPYLEASSHDLQGLHDQLAGLMQLSTKNTKAEPFGAYAAPAGAPNLVVVLAPDNVALASAGVGQDALGQMLASAPVHSAVRDAWTGDQDSERMAAHLPDGRTAAAAPLIDYNGRILGVVLAAYSGRAAQAAAAAAQNSQLQVVGSVLAGMVSGTLFFGLGASALGILTGVVFSRRLTRRLKRITGAAHCWSTGAFHITVPDMSHDEIGMLARDLNAMAAQLQHLVATRQELAVVEERHRLARDLHDSVKQQMFVLTMLVGTARAAVAGNAEAERTLGEAEQLAGRTQQELTALIRTLRPVALADKGLRAALQELCSDWSQRTGIATELDVPDELPVGLRAEQELFRVAQEALANVARHSGATAVAISANVERESVRLTIQDDGHGFDQAQPDGSGLGLSSMRERVDALGGSLLVFSSAEGTRIEASAPASSMLTSAAL